MNKNPLTIQKAIYHSLCIIISLIFIIPIFWSLMASFRPELNVMQGLSPLNINTLLPIPFTLSNYHAIFANTLFTRALLNTFVISFITVFFGIIINATAGFSFTVFDFPGKKILFSIVIVSFLLPGDVLTIPAYNLIDLMGLIDTRVALILPGLGNGMVIFLFLQFFKQIPASIRESAIIDGASHFQILTNIYLPLTIPTIIGGSLMIFIVQWESFLWPLVIVRSPENQMIQVALSTFNQQHQTSWGQILGAASLLSLIPLLLLMPLQKYYVTSITSGAIKE